MIATWMVSAALFTLFLGVAAFCAESALRAVGRQARWVWLAALGVSVGWPAAAPWLRDVLPTTGSVHSFAASVPTIYVVPARLPAPVPWTARLDVLVIALWAAATLLMFVRLGRAVLVLARIQRTAAPRVVDGVPVLVSEHMGPAVIGVVNPTVLFPQSLLELDVTQRRMVLEHEQEHCRARDPWFVLVSAVSLALVPWNLPLWWIVRRARLALEIDCDARVLARSGDVTSYGKLLLLISQRQTSMALSPMLAASPSQLERRIIAMRASRLPRRSLRAAVALTGALVATGVACASRIGDRVAGPSPVTPPAMAGKIVADPDRVFFEFQVEHQVRQIPGVRNLRYPDSLRRANVEGEVLAQFVVLADGRFEAGTFKVLKSTHPLFTAAVEQALPNMRFEPARIGGKAVIQLVQQPFTFSLSRSDAPQTEQPRPMQLGDRTSVGAAEAPKAAVAPSGYREFTVERRAQLLSDSPAPEYPDSLQRAKVSGEVVAQFVVERDGSYMPGTFKVLRSSHSLFTDAVRDAVQRMRFSPAMVEGKAVRQLIQMPFAFNTNGGAARVEQKVEILPVSRND